MLRSSAIVRVPAVGGSRTDLTGKRFGEWTVIGPTSERAGRHYKWACRCSCGTERRVTSPSLRNGASTSCGCRRTATLRRIKTKHGRTGTAEHRAWKHMHGRCYDENDKRFRDYGGRGIVVCHRWHEFVAFFADVGPRPSPKHSLERENVNGHYEPGNVIWATAKVQAANTRRTAFVIYQGKRHKLIDLAARLDVSIDTLHKRALRGTLGTSYAR